MDKFNDFLKGRVTTDAVHKRFQVNKVSDKNSISNDSYSYTCQCEMKIPVSPDKSELHSHFATVEHRPFGSCVYCSKPVFRYKYNGKYEVYHMCRQERPHVNQERKSSDCTTNTK